MSTLTLTDHLSSPATPNYTTAFAHPFLATASSLSRLALCLYQDRIYAAQAYPRFIPQLTSKIPPDDPNTAELSIRTPTVLVGCLTNIERKPTRDHTAEMARISALASLEDGLVFLWAMEKVYLDTWSVVPELSPSQAQDDLAVKAIRDISYSWSNANPDFVQFVRGIGDLVNEYFAPVMAGQSVAASRNVSEALARAEAIWARVVELEAEFWPNVEGEEGTLRASK